MSSPPRTGAQPVPGDRRVVTVVFADLSGFTALAGRMAPSELALVIDPIVAGLARIVSRYGGSVEKFAGDAVLAMFGAPMAHEDDAERALLAALEMHDLLPMLSSHPAAATLSLHIGVNTGAVYARTIGDAAHMDYAVLGEAVVLAQRLESQAPAGETFVGLETARMAGPGFHFEPLGDLTVKGRAEPVPAVRLVGRRGPRAGPRHRHDTVVGREAERAVLEDLAFGRVDAVMLVGEAGLGKTTLARWVAHRAVEAGLGVLQLGARSYGIATPYLPIVQALGEHAAGAPDDPVLTSLLNQPTETDPLVGLTPEARQQRVVGSLLGWIRSGRTAAGLLLVVEDLHFADAATVELLSGLLADSDGTISLLATSRPMTEGPVEELLALVGRRGHRLDLAPLSPDELRDLIAAELGGPPDARVVALVDERCEGNPLFVVELAGLLAESGTVVDRDGRWRLAHTGGDADVPATVGVLFGSRLDELPPLLAETVFAAAVLGTAPEPEVVARMLDIDAGAVTDRFERLAGLRLLDSAPDGWQFRHALLRDAIEERLAPTRSRDLRLRAAEAIAQVRPPGPRADAEIGHHLHAAGAMRLALPYLVASAAASRAVHAHRVAVPVLRRATAAAGLSPPDPRLPALLADLGDSAEAIGDYVEAEQALAAGAAAAVAGGDADLAVLAWARLGAVRRRTGAYGEALASLEDSLAEATALGVDHRPLVLEHATTLHLMGRLDEAAVSLEGGLRDGAEDTWRARLLTQRGAQRARVGELTGAAADLDEALLLLAAGDDPTSVVTALMFRGEVHERSGEADDAREIYRRAHLEAQRLGRVEEAAAILNNLGFLALARSDWDEARHIFASATEEFAAVHHRAGQVTASANHAYALAMLGDLDAAARLADAAAVGAEELGRISVAADARTTQALVARLRGDLAAAERLALDALATARRSQDPDLVAAAADLLEEIRDPEG